MFRRPPLHYPERPLHHFLQDAADRHPEKIALRFEDDVYTYRELDSTGNSFANALLALGFGPGTRVALADHQPARVDHRPARREPGRGCGRAPEPHVEGVGVRARVRAHRTPTSSWPTPRWPRCSTRPARPRTRICVDADAPPGWLSFWDLVFGTPGQAPRTVARERARCRLRVPVQLGHDGPAQGGAPHPPVAGRRGHQLELGVRGARRRSRAVLPAAVPHLRDRDHGLHVGVGRDHHVVPALRPRHDAVAHRADPGDAWRSAPRPSRWRWPITPSSRSTTSRRCAT